MGRLEVQLMVSFKSLFVDFKTQNWEAPVSIRVAKIEYMTLFNCT